MKSSSHISPTSRGPQGRPRKRVVGRRDAVTVQPMPLQGQLASDRCLVDVVHLTAVRAALAALPDDDRIGPVAELLALLSNPTRLRMLLALQPGLEPRAELCVCDLATVCHASKSLTSHQLRLLRASGLVRQRRAGRLMFYRLAEGPLLSLLVDIARLARRADLAESQPVVRRNVRSAGRGGSRG